MTDTTTEETATVLQVFIVRHGETEENRQGIMQGHFDSVLNEAGVGQAQLTASALEKVPFTMAHSSDLQRAVKVKMMFVSQHRIYANACYTDRRDHSFQAKRRQVGTARGVKRTSAYDRMCK